MDTTVIKSKIMEIVNSELAGFYIRIQDRTHFFDKSPQLAIKIAASDYEINRVAGQCPQAVSMLLDINSMELSVQVFGCMGGNAIFLIPDPNHPKEKYLAMASVKVPFRTPQKNEEAVFKAIKMFAIRYKNLLIENKDRLMYQNYVDYSSLLK
jgi:hypothetical protein